MPKPEDNLKSNGLCLTVSSSRGQEDKEAAGRGTKEEEVGRHTQEDKAPSVLETMSWPDLLVWKGNWLWGHPQILSLCKQSTLLSKDNEWRALDSNLERVDKPQTSLPEHQQHTESSLSTHSCGQCMEMGSGHFDLVAKCWLGEVATVAKGCQIPFCAAVWVTSDTTSIPATHSASEWKRRISSKICHLQKVWTAPLTRSVFSSL